MRLDYIICSYLGKQVAHMSKRSLIAIMDLLPGELLEVINNGFDNCSKECPHWNKYPQEMDDKRQLYKNDLGAQLWGDRQEKMIEMYYQVTKPRGTARCHHPGGGSQPDQQ